MSSHAGRVLPEDLVATLRRVRRVEAIALETGGAEARQRAIRATGAVILAAVELGWRTTEVAAVLELTPKATGNRLHAARALYGQHHPALVFDAPPDRRPGPRSVLATPVEDREWLSRTEAAGLARVHPYTIRNWIRAGLLPHTDRTHLPHLILRADLVRVMRAPRYNAHGVRYSAIHAQISSGSTQPIRHRRAY